MPPSNPFWVPKEICQSDKRCRLMYEQLPQVFEDAYVMNMSSFCEIYPAALPNMGINGLFSQLHPSSVWHELGQISMWFELQQTSLHNISRITSLLLALNSIQGMEVALAHGAFTHLVAVGPSIKSATALIPALIPPNKKSLHYAHLTGHGILLRTLIQTGWNYVPCVKPAPYGVLISIQKMDLAARQCGTLENNLLSSYCLDGIYMSFNLWSPTTLKEYVSMCSMALHRNDRCFARLAQKFQLAGLNLCSSVPDYVQLDCVNGTSYEAFFSQTHLPANISFLEYFPNALITFCSAVHPRLLTSCIQGSLLGAIHALHYRHFVDLVPQSVLKACDKFQVVRTLPHSVMHLACREAATMFIDLFPN